MHRFKSGDKVVSSISPDIEQPMTIVGIDRWFDTTKMLHGDIPTVYVAAGTHAVRKNPLTIRITDNWLTPAKE
jgi:hypothetical protein